MKKLRIPPLAVVWHLSSDVGDVCCMGRGILHWYRAHFDAHPGRLETGHALRGLIAARASGA